MTLAEINRTDYCTDMTLLGLTTLFARVHTVGARVVGLKSPYKVVEIR